MGNERTSVRLLFNSCGPGLAGTCRSSHVPSRLVLPHVSIVCDPLWVTLLGDGWSLPSISSGSDSAVSSTQLPRTRADSDSVVDSSKCHEYSPDEFRDELRLTRFN